MESLQKIKIGILLICIIILLNYAIQAINEGEIVPIVGSAIIIQILIYFIIQIASSKPPVGGSKQKSSLYLKLSQLFKSRRRKNIK